MLSEKGKIWERWLSTNSRGYEMLKTFDSLKVFEIRFEGYIFNKKIDILKSIGMLSSLYRHTCHTWSDLYQSLVNTLV